MDSDSEIEDAISNVDPNESDFLSSGDEYQPSPESDSDNSDQGRPTKPKKRKRTPKRRKDRCTFIDSEDDDVPLARIRDILKRGENAQLDDDVYQAMEEPMWVRDMPLAMFDTDFTGELEAPLKTMKTPFEFFKEIITDEMLDRVETESNNYAMIKTGKELKSTRKEIETFIGLYLRMGLMKAHCTRAYWAQKTRYPPVADWMTRNRFELIARTLHFTDNNQPDDNNRVWKIQPWLTSLQGNLGKLCPTETQSVDEIMIAFKGRCKVKQYIRNKPHKWGIKMWARCSNDGVLHQFEVYQGAKSEHNNSHLGMAGNVVMDMTSLLQEGKSYKIFADNLFSSINLVKSLRERGMHYVGTVRENRLKGCSLRPEKDMRKEPRGAMDSCLDVDSNILAVRWYDNKKVDVVSSYVGIEPVTKVTRFDRKAKKMIEVPCPAVVVTYNQNMGGVDLLDSLTALYKAKTKTRRWYLYIFYHTINMAVVTSWLRYRRQCHLLKVPHKKLSDFQADIADSLVNCMRKPGRPSLEASRPLTQASTPRAASFYPPTADVRLDMFAHMPQYGDRQWCKHPNCKQKTFIFCSKCKAHLCINKDRNCFEDYHINKHI